MVSGAKGTVHTIPNLISARHHKELLIKAVALDWTRGAMETGTAPGVTIVSHPGMKTQSGVITRQIIQDFLRIKNKTWS